MTPVTGLCAEARQAAQKLLNHYVKVQGLVISQMLRKSVETRDWITTIEPRNVRAVMKRVVEDATSIDVQVWREVVQCEKESQCCSGTRKAGVEGCGEGGLDTSPSSCPPSLQ